MKHMLIYAWVTLLMGVCFISLSPGAQAGSLQSYAKDLYYLGAGGTPPTLEEFAVEPRKYLRSEEAYQSLKQAFGSDITDEEFSVLLASDQVRLQPCTGSISTSGISLVGAIGWSERSCYHNEQLIQQLINGEWVTVASQGCFNLVRAVRPPVSIPQPPSSRTIVVPQQSTLLWFERPHIPTSQCCEHCGHNHNYNYYLPDTILEIRRNPAVIKEFTIPQRMN